MATVERRRRVFNLGFNGSPFVLAQALLLIVGISHRSLTDLIELPAPGWFLVEVTVFEIILDGADERVVAAASTNVRGNKVEVGHLIWFDKSDSA